MLNITILKVKHDNVVTADRLQPYIRKCDIYSPEAGGMTAYNAAYGEEEWDAMLGRFPSEEGFKTWHREHAELPDPDQELFSRQEMLHVFRRRAHIYHLERFTKEQSASVMAQAGRGMALQREGTIDWLVGRKTKGVEKLYKGIRELGLSRRRRDEHIAQNIGAVEDILREKYTRLDKKDTINYVVTIGGMHPLERYITQPVTVIDIDMKPRKQDEELVEARIVAGATLEEMSDAIKDLLANPL